MLAILMLGSTTAIANDSYMGEILGGVTGGIIGNQVGGGSGKVVFTAIGAGIGAIVGGRVQDNMNSNRYERNDTVYRQPQTQYQSCTSWTETMDQYGNITRTRNCY